MSKQSRIVVVGCDPSSKKVAFAAQFGRRRFVRGEKLRGSAPYSPDSAKRAKQVCEEVIEQVAALVSDTPGVVPYLFVEEPVVGIGGVKSSLVQAYINGVVQSCFAEAGYKVHIVHVSTWKSALGIPTKGGKEPIYETMMQLDPSVVELCNGDGDLLDAAAICRAGRITLGFSGG